MSVVGHGQAPINHYRDLSGELGRIQAAIDVSIAEMSKTVFQGRLTDELTEFLGSWRGGFQAALDMGDDPEEVYREFIPLLQDNFVDDELNAPLGLKPVVGRNKKVYSDVSLIWKRLMGESLDEILPVEPHLAARQVAVFLARRDALPSSQALEERIARFMSNRVQLFESIRSLDEQEITWEAVRKRRENLNAVEAQRRSGDIQEFEVRANHVVEQACSLRDRVRESHARNMGAVTLLEERMKEEGRMMRGEISSLRPKMDLSQEIQKREPESEEEWRTLERICQNVEAKIGSKSDTAMKQRLLNACVQKMEIDCSLAKERIDKEIARLEKTVAASEGIIEKLSSEIRTIENGQKALKVGLDDLKIKQLETEKLIATAKKAAEEKKKEKDKKRKQMIKTMQITLRVAGTIAATWVAVECLDLPITFAFLS